MNLGAKGKWMEGGNDAVKILICPVLYCTTTESDLIVLPVKWTSGLYSLNHHLLNSHTHSLTLSLTLIYSRTHSLTHCGVLLSLPGLWWPGDPGGHDDGSRDGTQLWHGAWQRHQVQLSSGQVHHGRHQRVGNLATASLVLSAPRMSVRPIKIYVAVRVRCTTLSYDDDLPWVLSVFEHLPRPESLGNQTVLQV